MKLFTILLLLFTLEVSRAEDFKPQFEALKAKDDHAAIQKLIEDSAKAEADNPEYYVLSANYWWGNAKSIAITTKPSEPGDISVQDQKTGDEVGSISFGGKSNPKFSKRAIDTLAEGARRFPLRADISLGLAFLQMELEQHADYTATLLSLLQVFRENPDKMLWKDNGPFPKKPELFLPESIQRYSTTLFRADSPETDEMCRKLCEALTETFPDHPYAYNILAALASAQKRPEDTIKWLKLAIEKAPEDTLVLENLADEFVRQGKKDEALKSYNQVLKLKPDEEQKERVKASLKKLSAGAKSKKK